MKKVFLMTALCLSLFACGNSKAEREVKQQADTSKADVVEVLYFYGAQRCPTCRAIEEETKNVVSTAFADDVANGRLVYKAVDIGKNEALADKYQVTWSSLVLVDHENGAEATEDMTKFAFGNARKSPVAFRKGLADKIREMLN